MKRWWDRWSSLAFGLDLRSLAAVRMGYAVLILCDLLVRATGLEAHYTDAGIMPRSLVNSTGLPFSVSFHAINGELWFQGALFLINAVAALALFLGWRTRWATFLCWLLMTSLHNRNFLLLNGGDTWMRLTLFWALFLPWGEIWSLDARNTQKRESMQILSGATLAYCAQVFAVYFLAGVFKTGAAWWSEGSATHLSMALSEWNGELAYYMLFYPEVMKWLTFSILVYELCGPFILFAPYATRELRTLSVFGFVGFHIGLALFIEIGIFPYVGMVTVLGLLPGWFWEIKPGRILARQIANLWRLIPSKREHPKLSPLRLSPVVNATLGGLVFYLGIWNLATVKVEYSPAPRAQVPAHFLRLDQYWALFAPEPPRHHSWFILEGQLESGRQVDLLRDGKQLSWACPTSSSIYKNQRWKRLYVGESSTYGAFSRDAFMRYFFRIWEKRLPGLVSIKFYRLSRPSHLNFEDQPPNKLLVAEMSKDDL